MIRNELYQVYPITPNLSCLCEPWRAILNISDGAIVSRLIARIFEISLHACKTTSILVARIGQTQPEAHE